MNDPAVIRIDTINRKRPPIVNGRDLSKKEGRPTDLLSFSAAKKTFIYLATVGRRLKNVFDLIHELFRKFSCFFFTFLDKKKIIGRSI